MVYRLQKRDRVFEQQTEIKRREIEKQQEISRQEREKQVELTQRRQELAEKKEREQREVRRAQHQDDYRAAINALNVLQLIFEKAARSPLSDEQLEEEKLEEHRDIIDAISKRVPGLRGALSSVTLAVHMISAYDFPETWQFEDALENSSNLQSIMAKAISSAISQREGADKGLDRIAKAREAIAQEWGS
jgi:cation transport ATPase